MLSTYRSLRRPWHGTRTLLHISMSGTYCRGIDSHSRVSDGQTDGGKGGRGRMKEGEGEGELGKGETSGFLDNSERRSR